LVEYILYHPKCLKLLGCAVTLPLLEILVNSYHAQQEWNVLVMRPLEGAAHMVHPWLVYAEDFELASELECSTLKAFDDPSPRDLGRRIWSAQASGPAAPAFVAINPPFLPQTIPEPHQCRTPFRTVSVDDGKNKSVILLVEKNV